MEETIEKEVLTTRSVQRYLRKLALGRFFATGLFWAIFGMILLPIIVVGPVLPLVIMLILASVALLGLLANSLALFVMSFYRPIMVKATRVKPPVGEKETYYISYRRRNKCYILFFHGYGKFRLPNVMYEDFESYTLFGEQLWSSTLYGDEFYLLMDKFDRIVEVFPCCNFEYVGELTPSKYEK